MCPGPHLAAPLENLLNSLLQQGAGPRCVFDKAFLFDAPTKLVIATDSNPPQEGTYQVRGDGTGREGRRGAMGLWRGRREWLCVGRARVRVYLVKWGRGVVVVEDVWSKGCGGGGLLWGHGGENTFLLNYGAGSVVWGWERRQLERGGRQVRVRYFVGRRRARYNEVGGAGRMGVASGGGKGRPQKASCELAMSVRVDRLLLRVDRLLREIGCCV